MKISPGENIKRGNSTFHGKRKVKTEGENIKYSDRVTIDGIGKEILHQPLKSSNRSNKNASSPQLKLRDVLTSQCGTFTSALGASSISGFPLPGEIFEKAIDRIASPTRTERIGKIKINHFDNLEITDSLRVNVGKAFYLKTETAVDDYSITGVDLGRGLFLDLNGNLTFNPFKMENHDLEEITVDHPGWGNNTVITVNDDGVRINHPGWNNFTYVSQKGDTITINQPEWGVNTYIRQKDGRSEVVHPGWGGVTVFSKQGDTTSVQHPGALGKTYVTRQGDTTIIQPRDLSQGRVYIKRDGNRTTIIYPHNADRVHILKYPDRQVIFRESDPLNRTTISFEKDRTVIAEAGFMGARTVIRTS